MGLTLESWDFVTLEIIRILSVYYDYLLISKAQNDSAFHPISVISTEKNLLYYLL